LLKGILSGRVVEAVGNAIPVFRPGRSFFCLHADNKARDNRNDRSNDIGAHDSLSENMRAADAWPERVWSHAERYRLGGGIGRGFRIEPEEVSKIEASPVRTDC
jgi:hypothetical protein